MQVSDTDIKSAWEDSMGSAILALRYWGGKCQPRLRAWPHGFFGIRLPLSRDKWIRAGSTDRKRVDMVEKAKIS